MPEKTLEKYSFPDFHLGHNCMKFCGCKVCFYQTLQPNWDWLGDFLTSRRACQDCQKDFSVITDTGIPQGCVLSPIIYTLFTHDCVTSHKNHIILKFVDKTTVIGHITDVDEATYRRKVARLVMKNMIVDTFYPGA